jgi:hypothetical protein
MFVWVELYFGDVPDRTDEEDGSVLTPERQFWLRLIEAGLLTAPSWMFSPAKHAEAEGSVFSLGEEGRQVGHLRMSYTPPDVSFSPKRYASVALVAVCCRLLTDSTLGL